jgi:sugar phosphate isomerase/epimerase
VKIGAQFYTLREYTTTRVGLQQSLTRVRDMGYAGVQLSAVACMNGPNPEVDAAGVREMLDALGLGAGATHRPWDDLLNRTSAEIAFHKALGCDNVFLSMAPPEVVEAGAEGYRQFFVAMRRVFDAFASEGILFGYHNHAVEFARSGIRGLRPYDVIREAEWLPFELDTYWAHVAGMSLPGMIRNFSGRLPVVHLKDVGVYKGRPDIAPVGEGNLDWDEILAAFADAGTEWLMVELDTCPRDPFDCLEASAEFLSEKLGL